MLRTMRHAISHTCRQHLWTSNHISYLPWGCTRVSLAVLKWRCTSTESTVHCVALSIILTLVLWLCSTLGWCSLVITSCLVQHTSICTWHYFELKQLVMTKLHHLKVEHNYNTNVRMILKATQCTVDSVEVHLHFRTARRTLNCATSG